MIASQFCLDHRLAELRQAGADPRVAQGAGRSTQPNGGTVRSLIGSLRSLIGGSTSASRPAGFAAH